MHSKQSDKGAKPTSHSEQSDKGAKPTSHSKQSDKGAKPTSHSEQSDKGAEPTLHSEHSDKDAEPTSTIITPLDPKEQEPWLGMSKSGPVDEDHVVAVEKDNREIRKILSSATSELLIQNYG